jgi:hypothetical protein
MIASVHVGQAQVALARDELDDASRQALAALDVAHVDHLPIAAVDALDLLDAVNERRGRMSASLIGGAAAAERLRLRYRFCIVPTSTATELAEGGDHLDVSDVITALVGRQHST